MRFAGYKYLALITLLVLGFAFYWLEYRPTKIKETCSAEAHMGLRILAESNDSRRQEMINNYYDDCLKWLSG